MKKGDYINFQDSNGILGHGVVVSFCEFKAKNIVNRGGFVEAVTVLRSDGKLIEMVMAPWHQFTVISREES